MAILSRKVEASLNGLYLGYDSLPQSGFARWFFPIKMTEILEKYKSRPKDAWTALMLCETYHESCFFERWFYPFLNDFTKSPLMTAYCTLKKNDLLSDDQLHENLTAVIEHDDPTGVANALAILNYAGLLTDDLAQKNREIIIKHHYPTDLAYAFAYVHYHYFTTPLTQYPEEYYSSNSFTHMQTQNNFELLAKHPNPWEVAQALKTLQLYHDEQANFIAVVNHQQPLSAAIALNHLSQYGLLYGDMAQVNRHAISQHKKPQELAEAIKTIHAYNLLSHDIHKAITNHQHPSKLAQVLILLDQSGILSGSQAAANKEAISKNKYPESIGKTLLILHDTHLLEGQMANANRKALAKYQPAWLSEAFINIKKLNLLTGPNAQSNFNEIMPYLHVLFGTVYLRQLWAKIPHNALTQQHFNNIIALCKIATENTKACRLSFTQYIQDNLIQDKIVKSAA